MVLTITYEYEQKLPVYTMINTSVHGVNLDVIRYPITNNKHSPLIGCCVLLRILLCGYGQFPNHHHQVSSCKDGGVCVLSNFVGVSHWELGTEQWYSIVAKTGLWKGR